MGQGLSITADSKLVTFNSLALHYQDEAYTMAFYLLGDEKRAEKATQVAFKQLFLHTRVSADRFRLEVLRRVLNNCYGWFGSLPVRQKAGTAAESRDDLSSKLLELQESERSAVVLVDVLGLDYEEAAHVLGSSRKQVSKMLAQARLNLSQVRVTQ
jgi:hypothetical protein